MYNNHTTAVMDFELLKYVVFIHMKEEKLLYFRAIFATRLSPPAVYFIQTGGSALSNKLKYK